MKSGSIPSGIREAAQHWVLRMQSRECGSREREAFERWRHADPVHDAAFRAVEDVWQRSAALADDPGMDHILRQARHLSPERSRLRRAAPGLAIAACLLLAVGVGYNRWHLPEEVPSIVYATTIGEQRTVALDDGSRVVLDTDSELQVQYGRRERRLTLLRGRADFQVQHDTDRPFVVLVGDGSITATGTQFHVRTADDASIVTLLEGQVVVAAQSEERAGDQVTLRAGERVVIRPDGRLGAPERLSETEMAGARGWTKGMLIVRDWPLSRLVAEINRYTTTPIRLADRSLDDLPMSGSFRASDQQSFLLSLEYSAPVRVDRTTPGEIVVRRK